MKYFVAFFHCKIINGYQTFTFTFTSKSEVFTDDEVKRSALNTMPNEHKKLLIGELIIQKTVRVTKREYTRINSEMK